MKARKTGDVKNQLTPELTPNDIPRDVLQVMLLNGLLTMRLSVSDVINFFQTNRHFSNINTAIGTTSFWFKAWVVVIQSMQKDPYTEEDAIKDAIKITGIKYDYIINFLRLIIAQLITEPYKLKKTMKFDNVAYTFSMDFMHTFSNKAIISVYTPKGINDINMMSMVENIQKTLRKRFIRSSNNWGKSVFRLVIDLNPDDYQSQQFDIKKIIYTLLNDDGWYARFQDTRLGYYSAGTQGPLKFTDEKPRYLRCSVCKIEKAVNRCLDCNNDYFCKTCH